MPFRDALRPVCGVGPGLLATSLGVLGFNYFLEEPPHALGIDSLATWIDLVVLVLLALLINALAWSPRRAHRLAP